MIRIERHLLGPRVFVFGRRTHHFAAGLALLGIGAWLVYDDRVDFLDWVCR